MNMKLWVLLLVLVTVLQSRAEDDSITALISKLVNKVQEKYSSGDKLAAYLEEFKAHEELDSSRDTALLQQVSGQAAEIQNVVTSLEQAEQDRAANRETDKAQVASLLEQVTANGGDIQGLLTTVEEAQQEAHTKMLETESKLQTHVDELKQEDANLGAAVENVESEMTNVKNDLQTQIDELTKEKEKMQEQLDGYKNKVAELENSSGGSEAISYLWTIKNYKRNRWNRKKLTSPSFYSASLGTQEYGYNLQVYAYLHNKNYLSLFFKLLPGKYDDLLEWPFPQRVQFQLLPQRAGVSIMRNTTSISDEDRTDLTVFGRPTRSEGNLYGWGFNEYLEEKVVEEKYLGNDKIYVKVTVV